jgi:hypothetical protein
MTEENREIYKIAVKRLLQNHHFPMTWTTLWLVINGKFQIMKTLEQKFTHSSHSLGQKLLTMCSAFQGQFFTCICDETKTYNYGHCIEEKYAGHRVYQHTE